jgi:4-carboxymuconolactone decarboxylase
MPRVPMITERDGLATEHHAAFDAIATSRGAVRGPFAALMNAPALAERVAHVGTYVRYQSSLPADLRELAIIAVASELDCAFEMVAHHTAAAEVGVPETTITQVEAQAPLTEMEAGVACVVAYARELRRNNRVSQATFDAALGRFGVVGVTELTATLGYYAMIASVLNAFEVLPS